MYKSTGTIVRINETVQVTEKFSKREFVIEDNYGMYPQRILFQLTQDKTDLIDPYVEGQEITVNFNLRGREWTSPQGEIKCFNTLEAWRIEAKTAENVENQHSNVEKMSVSEKVENTANPSTAKEEDDDLPF